eukprot:g2753.t1
MSIAYLSSLRSKDPRTKVGACIVDEQSRIVGIGYNGFPTGCSDADLPWKSATEWTNVDAKVEVDVPWLSSKYPYICHAAINAILNSHNNLHGCRLYTTLFPNDECCKLIAQAGIKEVIYGDDKYHDDDAWVAARRILDVAGISAVNFGAKSGGASSSSFSPLPSSVSGAVWWCPGRWTTKSVRESLFGDCKMGLVDEDGKTNKNLVAKMVRILSRAAWNVWASVTAPALDLDVGKAPAAPAAELLVAPGVTNIATKATVIGLTGYTFFPTPTPNVLAAFVAGLLWLMIFLVGFCALFSLETPTKFVEKGLNMAKEY